MCVCVLTEKSWSLSISSLHYEVNKKIFSEFETHLPLIFSKREHWYLVVCVHVCVCVCAYVQLLSCVQLFATLWTVACQAPLSLEYSQQEHWSGLPFAPPGDLPNSM